MRLISECMREVACWLQHDANETYQQEGRIETRTNLYGNTTTYVFRPPPRFPIQRTLSDILRDSKLIYRVHGLFSWILRTTRAAINESLFDGLPTEEQTTKYERKGKLNVKDSRALFVALLSDLYQDEYITKSRSRTITEAISSMTTRAEHSDNDLDDDEDDDYDSLDYQFSSYGYQALKLFKNFIKKLNDINHLQYILHNWTIGNQLIIKYNNKIDNKELIRAFASVLQVR